MIRLPDRCQHDACDDINYPHDVGTKVQDTDSPSYAGGTTQTV